MKGLAVFSSFADGQNLSALHSLDVISHVPSVRVRLKLKKIIDSNHSYWSIREKLRADHVTGTRRLFPHDADDEPVLLVLAGLL